MRPMIDTQKFAAGATHRREKEYEKTQVCLHFTAGSSAQGCFAAFQRNKNGTAFILDRDGQIYQYFDPRFWNVHLYRHKKNEPWQYYELEKKTIGIEIVNLGPLTLDKKKGDLKTYYGKRYCSLDDVELYHKARTPFRKHLYWQNFTFPQYSSLNWLLDELESRFAISRLGPPPTPETPKLEPVRIAKSALKDLISFKGLTTHTNYRNDKYDVGPAFQWRSIHALIGE